MTPDEAELLASLEAQGAEFLKSFGDIGTKRKRSNVEFVRDVKRKVETKDEEDTEDEWTGFASDHVYETDFDMQQTSNGRGASQTPQVVVFSENASKHTLSHSHSRAFMSSKVSKLKESPMKPVDEKGQIDEDPDQDMSNLQNDALLHRLVHTKLLSGSLNPELNLTPAQRRKALAGRVLELAGDSKLGKGETVIRNDEKKRASKRVRDGMMVKQKERDVKSLDEAKNAGNYHPALKKLFAASTSDAQPRKRDRGLKMGVGKFSGGMLKLSQDEISSIREARSSPGRGRGGSRGGSRGRGRGKKP